MRCRTKLRGWSPLPPRIVSPIVDMTPYCILIFLSVSKPKLTHHYHLRPMVYIGALLVVSMGMDIHPPSEYHAEYFHYPKEPLCSLMHPSPINFWQPLLFLLSPWLLPFLECHRVGIIMLCLILGLTTSQ